MSVQSIARQFVELCNQGKNFDVMNTMYAETIVSVEASGRETVGKTPVIEKSKRWAANNTIHGGKVRGPYFNAGKDTINQFAVHFTFEITPKSTGQRITQDEVAVYTVNDDKITREQFFYEGNW